MLQYSMLRRQDILNELTILYIEDEKIILENITKVLELFVKKVITADNSDDAFDLYNSNTIDIIISDIELKGSSGIELIKQIRKFDKKIPIILISGYTDTKYLLEAVKLNLVEYIVKPVDLVELRSVLLETVDYILENNLFEIKFTNNITYNIKNNKLFNNGEIYEFTASELKLVELLLANKKDYTSIDTIKYHIWEDEIVSQNALKSLINKTRKKIGKETLQNLSGVGYKLNFQD